MEKANYDSVFSLAGSLATRINSLGLSQERIDGIKRGAHPEFWKHFDQLMRGDVELVETIRRIMDPSSEIQDWQDFYQKFFGLAVDLSGVRVPEGLERTVYIAMGISINAAVKAHRDRNIPFWKYCDGDLESVIQKSERGPVAASYAIRVKSGQEADEDLKNRSAEMIAEQNINTENLLERLVHGLKYYDETGKHLDVKNVTLCASSRFSYGSVPFVYRSGDGSVRVYWYFPLHRYDSLRARRAVR